MSKFEYSQKDRIGNISSQFEHQLKRKFLKVFVNYCVLPVLSSKSGCKNLSSLLSVFLMGGTKKCIGGWQCSFVDILAVLESAYDVQRKYSEVCLYCNFQKKKNFFGSAQGATASINPNRSPIRRGLKPGRGGGASVKVQETRHSAHKSENSEFCMTVSLH